jgi:hypothetical protein
MAMPSSVSVNLRNENLRKTGPEQGTIAVDLPYLLQFDAQ